MIYISVHVIYVSANYVAIPVEEFNFSASNIVGMAKKAANPSKKLKSAEAEKKVQYKLNSIKNDFESGKVKSFEQLFALIGPSIWAKMMHMGYDTFVNKSKNPGDFTNNELIYFAELVDVDVNLVLRFVFSSMKFKNKYKEGPSIRV